MAGLPLIFCLPVPSMVVAPELIRWIKPSLATPSGFQPVTRWTASGDQ